MVQWGQPCSYPIMSTDDSMSMQRTKYGHFRNSVVTTHNICETATVKCTVRSTEAVQRIH